ncbi:MAG: formate acetyltransferase, partial [Deltaproteobacteria bacterium HGW-Deltaproteobacteria-17]
EYYRKHDDRKAPEPLRKARALKHIMANKSVRIYPDELVLGNMGSERVSALVQPELAGLFMCEDLLWIGHRKTTPMSISLKNKLKLMSVLPYWGIHNMAMRAFRNKATLARYVMEQLVCTYYLINEAGGIGHFLPDYAEFAQLGTDGIRASIEGKVGDVYAAARIACDAVEIYADRLSEKARSEAAGATGERQAELTQMAEMLTRIPRRPAATFHEAAQAIWLAHMAINLESLNSAVSFGRMDQYLYPYYQADLEAGRITPERAADILLSFSAKCAEHVFLLSERVSQYHGGYLVVQSITMGGVDREGNDATNPLTMIMLDVAERCGLRDPNFVARVSPASDPSYVDRVIEAARAGNGFPAIFSDDAVVAALVAHGRPLEEARDWANVGCVEPSLPGKSFFSTDAGLMNLPICLEMALNDGRRFGRRRRFGTATGDASRFGSMDEVVDAFRAQVEFMVQRMVDDFHIVEAGNRDFHPTPFSSMLVDDCLQDGKDLSAGGARFNSSGIQGIGLADVADSLAALDRVVFADGRASMADVVEALRSDFAGQDSLRAALANAPKYGNDDAVPDGYANLVAHIFHDALGRHRNIRGGTYVPGFYSVTCHIAFGRYTSALPSGRRKGEPFASAIGPANGCDKLGPTAVLNSVARVDSSLIANGCALNLRFDPG